MGWLGIDGRWTREGRARIPAQNSGLLYGESVFEAIPLYGGKPLFWDDHLRRLGRGCAFLGWAPPTEGVLRRAAREAWRRWRGGDRGILRLNVVAPLRPRDTPARPAVGRPCVLAVLRPLRHDPSEPDPRGLEVGVSSWKVPGPEAYPFGFKTAFYLTVRRELKRHPAWQEMLRLGPSGAVVDGAFSAPLLLGPGWVAAPPEGSGGLQSVTRHRVLALCRRWGWRVRASAWGPAEVLRRGRELVFVGSGVGVAHARRLSGRDLGRPGPGVRRLWDAYRTWALSIGGS
jgi:D-alanine transaminase